MLSIQTMEHYIAKRMGGLKPHAILCVSLTNMMLNERSQTQNSAYCMVTFMQTSKQQNYPVLPGQWEVVPEKEHIRPSQVVDCLTVWVLTTGVCSLCKNSSQVVHLSIVQFSQCILYVNKS